MICTKGISGMGEHLARMAITSYWIARQKIVSVTFDHKIEERKVFPGECQNVHSHIEPSSLVWPLSISVRVSSSANL